MEEVIKSFKGFKPDMTCKGFQYKEGESYEEDTAIVCKKGFHACEYPLDCFKYYNPAESVFHEVEQSGKIDRDGDTKTASTKIKIGAEINIAGMVKAAIEYTVKRANKETGNDKNCGASSATGYKGASSADDENAVAVAWGYKSKAKGVLGSHLVFANWEYVGDEDDDSYDRSEPDAWELAGAVMVRVDGEKIKTDTWYTMKDGKVIEDV